MLPENAGERLPRRNQKQGRESIEGSDVALQLALPDVALGEVWSAVAQRAEEEDGPFILSGCEGPQRRHKLLAGYPVHWYRLTEVFRERRHVATIDWLERRGRLMKTVTVLLVVVLSLLAGCAATQKITVNTDPPGAEVSLTKCGVTEAHGGFQGVVVGGTGEPFEDVPIQLGTSPLEYEFRLKETKEHFSAPGMFVKVARKITEGLIRAEKGGGFAERRVAFTGEPLVINLRIEEEVPAPPPRGAPNQGQSEGTAP